jgi:hypothetical protein
VTRTSYRRSADQALARTAISASYPVIPPKANRKSKRECDFALYSTRYDKLARNYLAAVQLVAAIIPLN